MNFLTTKQALRVKKAGAIHGPRFVLATLLLAPSLLVMPSAFAQSVSSESRSQAVIRAELFMQLEQLQQEVRSLRNKVEQQERSLAQMQDDQRRRYLDLDQRLQAHSERLAGLEDLSLKPVLEGPEAQPDSLSREAAADAASAAADTPGGRRPLSDREAYRQAYQLVPERRFDEAISAFQAFIRNHAESRLIGNAYYWIGEIYMAQNRTADAEKMFEAVINRYPDSFKVADSLYKLGLIFSRYGNEEKARETLRSVIEKYPSEPAAQLASSWLERESSE